MSKYINHIFYINLDKRTDRREHIERVLREYNLYDISERYTAISTPHSGIVGCSFSHLNVLKTAKERGYENILILEDDFEFLVSPEEFENKIRRFFERGNKYDVCMLGHIIQKYEAIPECDFLRKVIDGQTASAYIVHRNFLPKLIELYEWSCPLLEQTNHHWLYANDMVWKKLQPQNQWFCFFPKLGKQLDGYSDNKMCDVVYD